MAQTLRLCRVRDQLRSRRESILFLALFALLTASCGGRLFASNLPLQAGVAVQKGRLYVHGREVFTDVPPVRSGGDVYVPLRFVGESLGARVAYLKEQKAVRVDRGDQHLLFVVGKNFYFKNGKRRNLAMPIFIYKARSMIPFALTKREVQVPRLSKENSFQASFWKIPPKSFWDRVVYIFGKERLKTGNIFVSRLTLALWFLGMVLFAAQSFGEWWRRHRAQKS